MIAVKRLNLDTSWIFTMGETKLLVDPWLIGSEVDGFSWFNEAWHIKEPVSPLDVPAYDAVLISQSYEDHCHLPTLRALPNQAPLLGTGKAFHRLKKKFPSAAIHKIPDYPAAPLHINGVNIYGLHPGRRMDPVYYAVILEHEGEAIFYASHGFVLDESLAARLREQFNFVLLVTTFTHFKLPAFLGGDVNPGTPNALSLVEALSPEYAIGTHDEEKQSKGLVSKLARVTYPDYHAIRVPQGTQLLTLDNYDEVLLD